ncbi:MAG: methyltransferase, CheR-type, SAM-binding domain, C-terminal [Actinomycetia bacterium]|nr:methyltransferase, CheR-type, SAM-binding domain, C-terminal [Actinomycetes bacterium]
MAKGDLEALELRLLLDAVYHHYGYDFRGYARTSLKRRIWRRITEEGLETVSGLQERILHDPDVLERLLVDFSINVTSMFRDPTFFCALRETVVPMLKTYPFVRIWNAGCSTGEETYSLAIVLREEGLADRARIYATDINAEVLRRAKEGVFPVERMKDYTRDYINAGGAASFSDYYKTYGDVVRFDPTLADNVVFAQHNLVSDGSFNEFNLIVCRNVMIYFDRALQDKVHELFYDSLVRFGILALGHKETIRFTGHADDYAELDSQEKLYRRLA